MDGGMPAASRVMHALLRSPPLRHPSCAVAQTAQSPELPRAEKGGIAALRELRLYYSIVEHINAGLRLPEVLDQVYESFRPLLPYDRIGVATISEDGASVVARWARTEARTARIDAGYQAPLQGSSLLEVLETGRPRILNDLVGYYERTGSRSTRLMVDEGMKSSLTCPLLARGRPVGFIFFSSMEKEAYRDVHVESFLAVAGHLSLIIEKSRLYEELVELSAFRNRFLGVAAHDLRSPLGILRGYLLLLSQGVYGDPGEAMDVYKRMDRACQKMLGLVEDFLDASAIESGDLELKLEALDLAAILRERCVDSEAFAMAKSIVVQLDLEPDLPRVSADAHRVDQVLGNLVDNAVKFSEPDTSITIGARCVGEWVEVFVRDRGQGIPADEIPALLAGGRASVRPTAGEKSTGLGLVIARRLVEAHGGHLDVESTRGEGSTFRFTLPAA